MVRITSRTLTLPFIVVACPVSAPADQLAPINGRARYYAACSAATSHSVSKFIVIIKETALCYVIALNEITYSADQSNTNLLVGLIEIFAFLAISYFVICSRLSVLLERRLAVSARPAQQADKAPKRQLWPGPDRAPAN